MTPAPPARATRALALYTSMSAAAMFAMYAASAAAETPSALPGAPPSAPPTASADPVFGAAAALPNAAFPVGELPATVALDGPSRRGARMDADQVEVRFGLTLPEGTTLPATCSPEVVSAALGDPLTDQDPSGFSAHVAGSTVVVAIDTARVRTPGSYHLSVALPGCTRVPAAPLALAVDVPQAELGVPSELRVERRVHLVDWFPEESYSSLVLEVGPLRRLTGVTVTSPAPFAVGAEHVPVDIEAAAPAGALAAGSAAPIAWHLSGPVPVGDLEGTLRVDAHELEPVDIPVRVHTRVWPAWIIVIVLAGAFAGWFVRVWLTGRVARDAARAAADELRRRLATAAAGDAPFSAELARIRATLADTAGDSPERIQAAVTAADTAFEAARDALAARTQAAEATFSATQAIVAGVRPLPAELLAEVDMWMDEVAETLTRGDALQAATVASADTLRHRLADAAVAWRFGVGSAFIRGADLGELLAPPLAESPVAAAVNTPTNPEETPDLPTLLDAARVLETQLDTLAEGVAGQVARNIEGCVRAARGGRVQSPQTVAEARAAVDRIRAALTGRDASFVHVLEAALAAVTPVEALVKAHLPPDVATVRVVTDALAAGRYVTAAQAISAADELVGQGTRGPVSAAPPAADPRMTPPAAWRAPLRRETTVAPHRPMDRLPSPDRRAAMLSAAAWHSAAALVVGLSSYTLYAPTFIGHPTEIIAIFSWAFGLNLTAAKALERAAAAAKPPPAAA